MSACNTATPESQFATGKFVLSTDAGSGYDYCADGTFAFYVAASVQVQEGTDTVTGNQIAAVDPDEVNESCLKSGLANWEDDGTQVKVTTAGDDTCDARRETFGNTSYVRP